MCFQENKLQLNAIPHQIIVSLIAGGLREAIGYCSKLVESRLNSLRRFKRMSAYLLVERQPAVGSTPQTLWGE
jgi:hypothetical protein